MKIPNGSNLKHENTMRKGVLKVAYSEKEEKDRDMTDEEPEDFFESNTDSLYAKGFIYQRY